jgi:hypothetical protein
MDKQLKLLKKNICNLIKYTTEEKFSIEEDLHRIKQNYMYDEDFIQFDVLMAITVRFKIHSLADGYLRKIKRFENDIDLTRLKRLINIHKNQMKKLHTNRIHIQVTFYDEMLYSIEQSLRWLTLLLEHKCK